MRFRPAQHLRRQSEIRAAREQGTRIECRAFTLWWLPTSGSDPARVCVVASSHGVGHAVARARAKRRLRELFRRSQHLIPPACDLVMVARAAVNRWEFTELERAFAEGCQRGANRGRGSVSA